MCICIVSYYACCVGLGVLWVWRAVCCVCVVVLYVMYVLCEFYVSCVEGVMCIIYRMRVYIYRYFI